MAALNLAGEPVDWHSGISGRINSLYLADGKLYVGGQFDEAGGQFRENLAAFNLQGQVTDWNPSLEGVPRSLVVHEIGSLWVGAYALRTVKTDRT